MWFKRMMAWMAGYVLGATLVDVLRVTLTDFPSDWDSWQSTVVGVMTVIVGIKAGNDLERRYVRRREGSGS